MSKKRSIAKAVQDYNRFTKGKGNNTGAFYVSDFEEVREIATSPMGGRTIHSDRDSSRSNATEDYTALIEEILRG